MSILCALFFIGVARLAPHDIRILRGQMQQRAEERSL